MDPVLEKLQDIEKALKNQSLSQKRVFNLEELCEYFGFEKGTVYVWTSRKEIPHSKKSGLWFKREDVENWLLSNPITTEAQLEAQAASYIIKNRR